MNINDKAKIRLINIIISSAVICLTPLYKEYGISGSEHYAKAFSGKEMTCVMGFRSDMYNASGLEAGLNYELLHRFAHDNKCTIAIRSADRNENILDSIRTGRIDLIVTDDADSLDAYGLIALKRAGNSSVWAIRRNCVNEIRQLNYWIGHTEASGYLEKLKKAYTGPFDPHKREERGIISRTISPYDAIMKKYASELGWDWRMIAAVVYQESKFSISSRSFRGAQGLMQVMPQTGTYYGIDNLLDPELNIKAGTSHLKRLQQIFRKQNMAEEELVRFILAAYNAGEGRIMDCRNLAAAKGFDSDIWSEVAKVIPLMREDSILEEESVKHGKFYGYETIRYVEDVLSLYESICRICPQS